MDNKEIALGETESIIVTDNKKNASMQIPLKAYYAACGCATVVVVVGLAFLKSERDIYLKLFDGKFTFAKGKALDCLSAAA